MTSNHHHAFHETRLRVRYAETDQMGVVYHSNHLIWFEVGRVELMREMGFSYRHCGVPDDVIFTTAVFQGSAGNPEEIAAEMAEIKGKREKTQPRNRTGGSTFKNPPGASAWKLVDEAGCRGLKVGQAKVSELHSNFLINLEGASAADIETLGETVRERVKVHSGVDLEWEIKRIGVRA